MKTKKRATAKNDDNIPTLTEVVTPAPTVQLSEETLAILQAELSGRVLKLAEELTHSAVRDVGAVILESVCDQLRAQLPRIIDEALRAPLQKR